MKEAIGSTTVDNIAYVEALYSRYLHDRQSVPEAWRTLFAGWSDGNNGNTPSGPSFRARSLFDPAPPSGTRPTPEMDPLQASVRDRLHQLIRN
jgi:2-oxoglutarate dehydrogenase complex dehydrogenase (E1) component-like enzyme